MAMLTLAADMSSSDVACPEGAVDLRIEVATDLASAERTWRAFEAEAIASPYQRFDWISAFLEAGSEMRVATARDRAGRPALLLPLRLTRRAGVTVATTVGGKHANFQVPMAAGSVKLAPADATGLLREIGRAVGADTLSMSSVPVAWDGTPNPFSAAGSPSPSNAYQVRLGPDPDETALRTMTADARKRLRNKERGLAKLGTVEFAQARDPAEVERIYQAFFRQKDERFRELGIPDPFAEDAIRDAMWKGALDGLADGRPAIELYGLSVDGRVVAVLGGAADRNRLSGMFVSFESSTDIAKFSPGDILVSRIIREQSIRGRHFFDLGVGEARYKRTFCNETLDLVDVHLPVTAKGSAYAAIAEAALGLKRRIKKNPRAMALLSRARRAKAATIG